MSFQGGFTIVEVLIFLTISMVIFVGAQSVFQGQTGRTAFDQGMRNFASQVESYVDEVGNTVLPGGGLYSCSTSPISGRAVLSSGGSQGTNQGCIFLGRAIQVVPGHSTIYAYGVLGNQFDSDGNTVTSFAQTSPEPAFSQGTDLTTEYQMTFAKVSSSTVTLVNGTTASSDMVGFYNSLQDGFQNSLVGGAQSIFAKGYTFTSNDPATNRSAFVKSCIEEKNDNGAACAGSPVISKWELCLASTGSSQTALLDVYSTPAGVTTNTNFTACQ